MFTQRHSASGVQPTILSVYFSGTGHPIQHQEPLCLASVLFAATEEDTDHIKMGFDGCGVTHPVRGTLFGTGLEEQCEQVVLQVQGLLKNNKRVKINAYGHSRGAIACLMLATRLGRFNADLVEINLALMDPVPGNFITTARMDFFQLTLANQFRDLSDCQTLTRVLAIYPNEPLPDIIAHAPMLPKYPVACQVTEEIVYGCHADAQFLQLGEHGYQGDLRANITFNLVFKFLRTAGTTFNDTLQSANQKYDTGEINTALLQDYDTIITNQSIVLNTRLSRASHGSSSIRTCPNAKYLTSTHQALANEHKKQHPQAAIERKGVDYTLEHACFFSPPRSQPKKQSEFKHTTIEEKSVQLLDDFLDAILLIGMSDKSKRGVKGDLFKKISHQVKSFRDAQKTLDSKQYKNLLRNAIAVCLQRDRNAYSPFSTTRSGFKALELLNSDQYKPLANIILNNNDKPVRYRDMRAFVLGENNEKFFSAKKSQSMYSYFKPAEDSKTSDDFERRLLSDNIQFYTRP